MHAVLRVDLQPRIALLGTDDLIDARRAVAGFGAGKRVEVDVDRLIRITQLEMDRLVLLVIGVGQEDR